MVKKRVKEKPKVYEVEFYVGPDGQELCLIFHNGKPLVILTPEEFDTFYEE